MKKRSNNRQGLSSDARAWLDGGKCGFYKFKHDDELETVWLEYGDASKMFWRRDMSLPITLDDLESREDAWLASGESDEYGGSSFFVYRFYSDAEKQNLWSERGDKKNFRWKVGMRKPESL